jgi:hypothetical protein
MQLTITNQGYAALVNAQQTGTNKVKLTQVAIGSGTGSMAPDATELADPIKTLDTFAGKATADNIISVQVEDDTDDAYTVREYGLLTDDDVLFAIYSQAEPIIEKGAPTTLLLALDCEFADMDTAQIAFGGVEYHNPAWSQNAPGVLKRASASEAKAGTDNTAGMSPLRVWQAIAQWLGKSGPASSYPVDISGNADKLGTRPAQDYPTATENKYSGDLNHLIVPGFYRDQGASNVPGTTYGQIEVIYGGADTLIQRYTEYDGETWYRGASKVPSGSSWPDVDYSQIKWTSWKKYYTNANDGKSSGLVAQDSAHADNSDKLEGHAPGKTNGLTVQYAAKADTSTNSGYSTLSGNTELFDGDSPSSFYKKSDWSNKHNPNGYVKLPDGTIIQWGNSTTGNTVTFPVSFNIAARTIQVTARAGANKDTAYEISNLTKSHVHIDTRGEDVYITWLAVGY